MPESVMQPGADHDHTTLENPEPSASTQQLLEERAQENAAPGEEPAETGTTTEKVIWTPGFLLAFSLILVVGLSVESLLTQGWENQLVDASSALLPHIILAAVAWLALGILTRSRWIRLGCIFGGIWAIFMGLNLFTNLQNIDFNSPIQSYINVATCMALLGAYIGISIEGTLLTNWDTWLFFLIPILSAVSVVILYFLTPQASLLTVENAIATTALIACCLIWWLRPSCWKKYPGPTFLFGLVPFIALAMAQLNASMHTFFLLQVANSHVNPLANANNFFFAQVMQLCLLLGCMRLAKSEIAH
jgi:hypothetical protein